MITNPYSILCRISNPPQPGTTAATGQICHNSKNALRQVLTECKDYIMNTGYIANVTNRQWVPLFLLVYMQFHPPVYFSNLIHS